MTDMGVCERCSAGDAGEEVELNEKGLCADCEAEDTDNGMGELDMGVEEEE
jgi:hypothetical protein